MKINSSEKGQALIIIALAAVGLFAFTALAIDGGMVFSDRRHSQNASDTAVLAAALARARASANWEQTGLDRAEVNGYSNATGSTVEVYLCSDANATCANLPAGIEDQYVQARITSTVKLFFAPIIGRQEVTNHTEAIARATIPEVTSWFDGKALVSTMEGCPPNGYPHDPFTVGGNSGTTIINSGIFVNSICEHPDAFEQGGSSTVTTDEGVCVVGSADYNPGVSPPPTEGCAQIDSSKYVLPNPACSQDGEIIEVSSGNYEAWPGNYNINNGTFPSDYLPNGSPAGILKLHKGIYCIYEDGISLPSQWDVTTNLNGNTDVNGKDIHDPESEGVFFFVPSGDITFNGGSDINIHAISSLADNFPEVFLNYLFYVPPSNQAVIKITGGNGSAFTGTILAPYSHVVLNGGSGTVGLDSQIIAYSVAIEGNGTLDITFNQANNAVTTTNPGIELTK